MKKRRLFFYLMFALGLSPINAQNSPFIDSSSSVNEENLYKMYDKRVKTGWRLSADNLESNQEVLFKLTKPGDLCMIRLNVSGIKLDQFKEVFVFHCTYDPMNPGPALDYQVKKEKSDYIITFSPRYGAFLKMIIQSNTTLHSLSINEINVGYIENNMSSNSVISKEMAWFDSTLSIDERIEKALAAMTTRDKMELLREGWGLPGIPALKIPHITKTEAIHGHSYKKGATMYPQSISLAATWDRPLLKEIGSAIGKEILDAHTLVAWSPVLDVAQDARWGRCEETYGEDPVLVSELSGKWIEGLQMEGAFATPKHFGAHGAPLGGRDSHDIGLSEREMREIHLVPFRNAFRNVKCQSTMMCYSDYLGIPVAKSHELLVNILREEWGFDGFIVSDCGALGNMTARKHYVAENKVEAAKQSLSVGIGTNCGDVYNDKEVISAALKGDINMDDLNNTCRDLLRFIIRNGLLENNPCDATEKEKNENPTFNCPKHQKIALKAALESITLLKNSNDILPLKKNISSIAVLGPAADNVQTGDYSGETLPGQLKSVLTGIKQKVNNKVNIYYEKGCDFNGESYVEIEKAVDLAKKSDVAVLVVGDLSNSKYDPNMRKTSGEGEDCAKLQLQGKQEQLIKAVCESGTPVVLIYQIGRPYNLSYAAEHADAILVNWLPGQEGGIAMAEVLTGEYSPAGRLPMTFPRDVAQLPLYYNFKTSGRGYHYTDMSFYPLYRFGYGLSYTKFEYSDIHVTPSDNGNLLISADVKNIGGQDGDEVVQLYATDMFASVKTRIMELKDFQRINLKRGESKHIVFEVKPYQLSLLNDKMKRVVEPGEFRFFIGGSSPEFNAGDMIKNSISYKNENEGVFCSYNNKKSYAAKFEFSNAERHSDGRISVVVTNKGNLTDVDQLNLYIDSNKIGYERHYELEPGESKTITFKVPSLTSSSSVVLVSDNNCIEVK